MRLRFLLAVVFVMGIMIPTWALSAGIPRSINYQGRLTEDLGKPVPDGSYLIKFTIWDASTAGTTLWTSGYREIIITNGLFNHQLGDSILIPDNLFAADSARYLGIRIGTDPEIIPRTKMTSVAFAYQALGADTAIIAKGATANSIDGIAILDGSIQLIDIGRNGADSGQVIKWNGTQWISANDEGGGEPEQDPQVGDNTLNYVPKWDGLALVTGTIYDNGNIGIGTASPVAKLDVNGAIAVGGTTVINGSGQWVGSPTGLVGPAPAHEWSGTNLRVQNPDGSWGVYVNLQGPTGSQGPNGPQGATGPQGPQGPQGLPGPAVHTSAVCSSSPLQCAGVCGGADKVVAQMSGMCTVTSDTGTCTDNISTGTCCVCRP